MKIWDIYKDKVFTVKGPSVTDDSVLALVGDGKTLVQLIQGSVNVLKLWAVEESVGEPQGPLAEIKLPKRILAYGPTLNHDLFVLFEGGFLSCYDGVSGKPIAEVENATGDIVHVKSDKDNHVLFLWSTDGLVSKFCQGTEYWSTWFVPDSPFR